MLPFHTAASCRFITNMETGWLHIYTHIFLTHTHTHTHTTHTSSTHCRLHTITHTHKYFLIHTLSAHCRSIIYIGGGGGLPTHTHTQTDTSPDAHTHTHTLLPLTTRPSSILATRTATTHARTQWHTSPLSHTHLHLLPTAGFSSIWLAWTTAMRTHINTHISGQTQNHILCSQQVRHLFGWAWTTTMHIHIHTHTYWRRHTSSTHCRFLINLVDSDGDQNLNPTEVTHTATLRWLRARTCVWRCIYGAGSFAFSFSVSLSVCLPLSCSFCLISFSPSMRSAPKVTHAATHAAT